MTLFVQHLRDGNNIQAQKQRLINQIANLIIDDKREYTWTLTKYDRSKTKSQLAYYFGVVIPALMEFQGCSKVEADEALRYELLPPDFREIFGKVIEYRPRIKNMKVKPMATYIDTCVNFLGAWGVFVPPAPYRGNEDESS